MKSNWAANASPAVDEIKIFDKTAKRSWNVLWPCHHNQKLFQQQEALATQSDFTSGLYCFWLLLFYTRGVLVEIVYYDD